MMRYYLDNFVDSLTGVVPGARVLINDLKAAGVHVWGLSNWQKDLFPVALDHYDILCSLEDAWCPVTWDCANRTAIFTITL